MKTATGQRCGATKQTTTLCSMIDLIALLLLMLLLGGATRASVAAAPDRRILLLRGGHAVSVLGTEGAQPGSRPGKDKNKDKKRQAGAGPARSRSRARAHRSNGLSGGETVQYSTAKLLTRTPTSATTTPPRATRQRLRGTMTIWTKVWILDSQLCTRAIQRTATVTCTTKWATKSFLRTLLGSTSWSTCPPSNATDDENESCGGAGTNSSANLSHLILLVIGDWEGPSALCSLQCAS